MCTSFITQKNAVKQGWRFWRCASPMKRSGSLFPELYYRSGIRPEAVRKLISPEMAESS